MARSTIPYRPALDGLRGIAVSAVLLYHAGVGWARGGFLGVDVFFVLSGFLITTLLLAERRAWGRIDLVDFYRRRARRLLPALFSVVLAVAVWARLAAPTDKLGSIRADGVASLLYVANLRFIVDNQSYFDRFGDPSPFRHMWSLAIEEQFYVAYPIFLIGLLTLTRGNRRRVMAAIAACIVASAVIMAAVNDPGLDPSRAYFGTDTRIQELLIGAFLGVALSRRKALRVPRPVAAYGGICAGLALLMCMILVRDSSSWLFTGGFTLICATAAIVIGSLELHPHGVMARALSWSPLVQIGLVSYGLYLWHWPVYVALSESRTGLSGAVLVVLRLVVSGAMAWASYRFLEEPIRARRFRLPGVNSLAGASSAAAVTLVVLLVSTQGATAGVSQASGTTVTRVEAGGATLRVMFVGDSVPWSLTTNFPKSVHPDITLSTLTPFGCGLVRFQHAVDGNDVPTPSNCLTGQLVTAPAVKDFNPDVALVFIGLGEMFDAHVGESFLQLGTQEHEAWLTAELDRVVEPLEALAVPVTIVNVGCYRIPEDNSDNSRVTNSAERITTINELLARYAAARHFGTVDLHGALCADGYTNVLEGETLRTDGVHFGPAGSERVWQFLAPEIRRLASGKPSS